MFIKQTIVEWIWEVFFLMHNSQIMYANDIGGLKHNLFSRPYQITNVRKTLFFPRTVWIASRKVSKCS